MLPETVVKIAYREMMRHRIEIIPGGKKQIHGPIKQVFSYACCPKSCSEATKGVTVRGTDHRRLGTFPRGPGFVMDKKSYASENDIRR